MTHASSKVPSNYENQVSFSKLLKYEICWNLECSKLYPFEHHDFVQFDDLFDKTETLLWYPSLQCQTKRWTPFETRRFEYD